MAKYKIAMQHSLVVEKQLDILIWSLYKRSSKTKKENTNRRYSLALFVYKSGMFKLLKHNAADKLRHADEKKKQNLRKQCGMMQ